MWPWHMWSGWGWGGMFIGVIFMLLFWGIVITLVFFAIRSLIRSNQSGESRDYPSRQPQTSLEILKERYARGEITRPEYQEMRSDLET